MSQVFTKWAFIRSLLRGLIIFLIGVFVTLSSADDTTSLESDFRFGWEVEVLPKVASRITHFYNFNSELIRQIISKEISDEDLNSVLEINPDLVNKLPINIQKTLTQGLNLDVNLVGGDDFEDIKASPLIITSPFEVQKMNQKKDEKKVEVFHQSESGLLLNAAGEWSQVHLRWKSLSRRTKLQSLNFNDLPQKVKSNLWHEHRFNPVVRENVPENIAGLLNRLSSIRDQDAIEFFHNIPRIKIDHAYSDLELFFKILGVERVGLAAKTESSGIVWGGVHLHGSRVEPFSEEVLRLIIFDHLLDTLNHGIINDLKNNDEINKYSRNMSGRGGIRVLAPNHIEKRNFIRSKKEEFESFALLFTMDNKELKQYLENKVSSNLQSNYQKYLRQIREEDPKLATDAAKDVLIRLAANVPSSHNEIRRLLISSLEHSQGEEVYRYLEFVKEITSKSFDVRFEKKLFRQLGNTSVLNKYLVEVFGYVQGTHRRKLNLKQVDRWLTLQNEVLNFGIMTVLFQEGSDRAIQKAHEIYDQLSDLAKQWILAHLWNFTDRPYAESFFRKELFDNNGPIENKNHALYGYYEAEGKFNRQDVLDYWNKNKDQLIDYSENNLEEEQSPLIYVAYAVSLINDREGFDVLKYILKNSHHKVAIKEAENIAARYPLNYSRFTFKNRLRKVLYEEGYKGITITMPPGATEYDLLRLAPKGLILYISNAGKHFYPVFVNPTIKKIKSNKISLKGKISWISALRDYPTYDGFTFLFHELKKEDNGLIMPIINQFLDMIEKGKELGLLGMVVEDQIKVIGEYPTELQGYLFKMKNLIEEKSAGDCLEQLQ